MITSEVTIQPSIKKIRNYDLVLQINKPWIVTLVHVMDSCTIDICNLTLDELINFNTNLKSKIDIEVEKLNQEIITIGQVTGESNDE